MEAQHRVFALSKSVFLLSDEDVAVKQQGGELKVFVKVCHHW